MFGLHLSAVSLNSLAEILRRANPLYNDCRSILNDFDACEVKVDSGDLIYLNRQV